ncbi:unnamed protein product [Paramecium primaurelia]|uniref:Uncharacterized protein n=1 Tax=Paramecium primaurelia TaxID=5886 RepID=A0A8S1K942_PARPR|nr:unnamed protein product [Paramecium primaurelia]
MSIFKKKKKQQRMLKSSFKIRIKPNINSHEYIHSIIIRKQFQISHPQVQPFIFLKNIELINFMQIHYINQLKSKMDYLLVLTILFPLPKNGIKIIKQLIQCQKYNLPYLKIFHFPQKPSLIILIRTIINYQLSKLIIIQQQLQLLQNKQQQKQQRMANKLIYMSSSVFEFGKVLFMPQEQKEENIKTEVKQKVDIELLNQSKILMQSIKQQKQLNDNLIDTYQNQTRIMKEIQLKEINASIYNQINKQY